MAAAAAASPTPASPRAGVIRVLVAALADDSADVREAASTALQENARWNSKTILDCCMTSLRTVRRRVGQQFSHHARVFHVMAYTVKVMDEQELDVGSMRKIAKLALMEMTTNKDINAIWQKAASGLLVAIGARLPDLMMEEIFLQLTGSTVSTSSVVQTLADFASSEACQFTPRVKGVFSRVLPLLGCVKDNQRVVFAAAFKQWSWAISQYYDENPWAPPLDSDTLAFLHSAFELFLGSWVAVRDQKVRLTTVEALGELVPLVSDSQRKAALPKLLPVILNMYKKDKDNILPVTRSLWVLLNTVLTPHSGSPPLLDFQGLQIVLTTLLPMASTYRKSKTNADSTMILRITNEVLQCFLTIGIAYNEEMVTYLISRLGSKEDSVRLGALSVFQHLLPRLHVAWDGRRSQLLDAIKPGLSEQDLNFRKALVELTVSMASCGWLEKGSGELFVEFLARQCALSEITGKSKVRETNSNKDLITKSSHVFKTELKVSPASPPELRAMCDKAMLLLAGTMPEMEPVLWPYLLKLIVAADYTEAVETICKCLSAMARRKEANFSSLETYFSSPVDIPKPEEVLARMLILLQNPLGRGRLAFQILTVLSHLGNLFPKSMALLWEDEIPKLKSYVDDPEDLKTESWQQATWDDMIIHLLAESLDVNQSTEWTLSLGNAFSDQYNLYIGDHAHSALLHRCLGVLLQRVDNRFYVREKLEVMFKNADVSDVANRLGLAMGFGLVAATHLDTVLEKLKRILETQNRNTFQRLFAFFSDQKNKTTVDDVYAALALMYGYTASYAASSVIEARIDALVGTNMLSGLLDVRTATAKQAVITAIDLLGQSVIKASYHGAPFPLKKRDDLLTYILTLMAAEDSKTDPELLHTQTLALNACTTLVSVEPKLTVSTRDVVLQATLDFFTLPIEPKQAIESLILKLTKLLRSILVTSGEDGKSKADQLHYLLRSLDQYVSSPASSQRSRACSAVLSLLSEFRGLCSTGSCALGCSGPCMHLRSSTTRLQRGGTESTVALLLPSRESLNLGERLMIYLPRCADPVPWVPKCSAQIIDLLFSIALLLPNPVGSTDGGNKQPSYAALSKLEELIAVSRWEAGNDTGNIFLRIVECVGNLLTTQELVIALRGCVPAICDKTQVSAKAIAGAVSQLIQRRGQDLQDEDVERITHSLLSAASLVGDGATRSETLNAVCSLAAHTQRKLVFDELLAAAEKDIATKDVSRLRGWPVQDAFYALAQNEVLSVPFLDYVVAILNQMPIFKDGGERMDSSDHVSHSHLFSQLPQAALVAVAAFFRKGTVSRRAVQQRYAAVFCSFLLQFGTYHTVALVDVQPLRNAIKAFQDFCECLGDKAMKKVLAQDGDQILAGEQWTTAIGQIASCVCEARPAEVEKICTNLWTVLKRPNESHRAVAAAVLSDYVHHSDAALLKQLVGALSAQIGDESAVVRQLCVKGLVEIPKEELSNYMAQVLSVIVALIEDTEEKVAATVVRGLIVVLEQATEDTVAPILLNLCGRLRTLQLQKNVDIRAASFGALGVLTRFGSAQRESFIEQVHAILPRVVFHLQDEALLVSQTCKGTLKVLLCYLEMEEAFLLMNSRAFNSIHRSDYEVFLKDFARILVKCQLARIDSYITIAIQNFDSSWPEIQANAAFFTACLLSQLVDHKILAVHLPQVVGSLVRMASNSPSSIVRASSSNSLSILLNSIH